MSEDEFLKVVLTAHTAEVKIQKEINGNWSVEEILSAIDQLLSK
jgi:hypothetical protein